MLSLIEKPIRNIEFAVIDIETTGLCRANDRIVEIAGVKIKDNRIKEHFSSLIYADHIPEQATRIHGIDTRMVRGAPSLEQVGKIFHEFITGSVLVGHNLVCFDLPFLRNAFAVSPDIFCVDTLKMSRKVFREERSHSLSSVACRMGVENGNYHRALNDAMVTAEVFLKIIALRKEDFRILKDIVA